MTTQIKKGMTWTLAETRFECFLFELSISSYLHKACVWGPFGGGWFMKLGFAISNPKNFFSYGSFSLVVNLLIAQFHFTFKNPFKAVKNED